MPDDRTNIDTVYAVASGRKLYYQQNLDDYEKHGVIGGTPRAVGDVAHSNLISSEIQPGRHMPVIDCDFGIQAVASSTPGHYHLYIDKEMTWEQYKALLNGLLNAGLIEYAWYDNAMNDKRSYVRLPHIRKDTKSAPAVDVPF